MKVKNILTREVKSSVLVEDFNRVKDMLVGDIAKDFVKLDLKAVIIIKDQYPYYFFSTSDIIKALMENEGEDELIEFIDLHPKKMLTVSVEDDLFDAYRLMRSARIRHLVVVDEFGKFVRVIESCDLVSFLTEIAIEDELTGLYNRRYFEFLLEKFRDSDKEIGIIFIDVNKFKELNDTYGHLFGDKVLYEVAKRIKSSIREIDHAFRYGGDEFVVMSFISAQDLKVIAKRLKNILNFEINNIKIKTSIGWAHYPNDSTDLYEVVEIADKMMYKNKKEEDD